MATTNEAELGRARSPVVTKTAHAPLVVAGALLLACGKSSGRSHDNNSIALPKVEKTRARAIGERALVVIRKSAPIAVGKLPAKLPLAGVALDSLPPVRAIRDDLHHDVLGVSFDDAAKTEDRSAATTNVEDPPPPPPDNGPKLTPAEVDDRVAKASALAASRYAVTRARKGDDVLANADGDLFATSEPGDPNASYLSAMFMAEGTTPARELVKALHDNSGRGEIAVTSDGDHALAFNLSFAGNSDDSLDGISEPAEIAPELVVQLGLTDATVTEHAGTQPLSQPFNWRGPIDGLPAALKGAGKRAELSDTDFVRIWFDESVTVDRLVAVMSALEQAGVNHILIGDPAPRDADAVATTNAVRRVRAGELKVTGALDPRFVERGVRHAVPRLAYCYEKELRTKPTLAGTVRTSFAIDERGAAVSVAAAGVDPTVAGCFADVIHGLEFPPSTSGAVSVEYSFTLAP